MQTFKDFNLSPPLAQAIADLGFEKPSPIQAEALPILLGEPTDFLGLAATGTGKTAAFAIPLLEKIDPTQRGVQVLILCPTRELAVQVAGQVNLLGKHKGVRALPVYGGAGYGDQIQGLKRGASVVVGTPGRVIDHLERGTLVLNNLTLVVLDEADEMISMGFKDALETILEGIPEGKGNIWLFSATMSREVRKVADTYLNSPQQVQINREEMLSQNVEQLYYMTRESDKPEVLCKLIDAAPDFYGLVFCQTKALVVDLIQYLRGRGYAVDCLHGDMDQASRDRTMKAFRERKVTLLICTDVASRGLDVKDITHVINFSIPRELDNYVHRIGRTARSGKSGVAMSLVTSSHRMLIGRIERMTKSRMKEGRIPTRKEIGAKKIELALARFEDQPNYSRATELMNEEWKRTVFGMSQDEVAARFLSMLFPEVFADRDANSPLPQAPVTPGSKASIVISAPSVERPAPAFREERPRTEGFRKKPYFEKSESRSFAEPRGQAEPRRYGDSRRFDAEPRRFDGERKPAGSPWKPRAEGAQSFAKPYGKPSFGAKPAFGGSADRPFARPAYGKPAFGGKPSFGAKPAFGGSADRPFSKPAYGKPFGKPSKPFVRAAKRDA